MYPEKNSGGGAYRWGVIAYRFNKMGFKETCKLARVNHIHPDYQKQVEAFYSKDIMRMSKNKIIMHTLVTMVVGLLPSLPEIGAAIVKGAVWVWQQALTLGGAIHGL